MKSFSWMAGVILALFVLAGCGGSTKIDTSPLEQSFQSAAAGPKADITKAVAAVKSGDFGAAATSIKAAIKAGGLSQEQKDAISQVATEMQMVASQDPEKYPLPVYTSIGEISPLLEGLTPKQTLPARP